MYKIRRDFNTQPVMPTGSNVLPPLSEFEVKKTQYSFDLHLPFGHYRIDIDTKKEVGFFEHVNGMCGQFWLAGRMLVACEHLVPSEVRTALKLNGIEVA